MNIIKTIHHTGRVFTLSASEADVTPPGKGTVLFEETGVSVQPAAEEDTFVVSALIRGENIAHVFAHVLLFDQDLNQFFGPVFHEYLVPEETKEVNGVQYPVWGSEFQAVYEFLPCLPILSAGEEASLGFAAPEKFSLNPELQTYRISGKYVYADEEKEHKATLRFNREGNLIDIILIKEKRGFGMPKPFQPAPGDRFAPQVKRYFADMAGNTVDNNSMLFSDELRLNSRVIRHFEPALPGTYLAGFLVQDFDGNVYHRYTTLTVE